MKSLSIANTNSKQKKRNKPKNEHEQFRGSDQTMFRRDDWMEFRDPNRISNKAGVPFVQLPKVVAKELADDALDASGDVEFGLLRASEGVTFFVADTGPGLAGTDEEIAELYSIRRPLTSSKMVRLPTRGMLGNGLRVVAGVVLVAGGQLRVSTRGRTLTLEPRAEDGRTAIIDVAPWKGTGTRVEVTLRGDLATLAGSEDGGLFDWAEESRRLRGGTQYKGKSSSHWYDTAGFWELLQGAGDVQIETFIEWTLEGCSDKATEVAGNLVGRPCDQITRPEAVAILQRAQSITRPVAPERLGKIGRRNDYFGYGYEAGKFETHGVKVPFVVEAWANRSSQPGGMVCVNRTPVCANVKVRRDEGSDYAMFGCQLSHAFAAGRKDGGDFKVLINVTAPTVPLTSSGKDPDLSSMWVEIRAALEKAIRVAKRTAPKTREKSGSQKSIIRARIQAASVKLSGHGEYLFSLRQLFYELRPYLIQALGREPKYGTFSRIVGGYEDDKGDIENFYRDDRGTLYHPHTREIIPLGTRSVAAYQRPAFGFSSILFCEKEGLFPMLKHAQWPERFDCALCSSKGFATRAARALIRLLQDSQEPITVFVIHDADGPGTVIFEALQKALAPYGIEVINLGLDPAEARDMGLAEESVKRKKNMRVPVAEYIPDDDKDWLQENRIELNAMTTPQFVEWLTAKVAAYFRTQRLSPKVIPPATIIREQLRQEMRSAIERRIVDEVMKAANIPGRVDAEFAKLKRDFQATKKELVLGMPDRLKNTQTAHWTDIVKIEASGIVGEKPVDFSKSAS